MIDLEELKDAFAQDNWEVPEALVHSQNELDCEIVTDSSDEDGYHNKAGNLTYVQYDENGKRINPDRVTKLDPTVKAKAGGGKPLVNGKQVANDSDSLIDLKNVLMPKSKVTHGTNNPLLASPNKNADGTPQLQINNDLIQSTEKVKSSPQKSAL